MPGSSREAAIKFLKTTENRLHILREDGLRFKPIESLLLQAKRTTKAKKADEAIKAINELSLRLESVNKYALKFVPLINACRENLELGKQMELDIEENQELLANAIEQFNDEQFNHAIGVAEECKQRTMDSIFLFITDEMKKVYNQFKQLPRNAIGSRDIQKLFSNSDTAIQDKNYRNAFDIIIQLKNIKDSLSKPIVEKLREKTKDEIIDFQNKIEDARKTGADLTDAKEVFAELVKRTKTAVELSEFVDVIDLASAGKHALERAIRRKERLEGRSHEAKEILDRLLTEITDLKEHIAIPSSVDELVNNAKNTLTENNFDDTKSLVNTCSQKLDKLRRGSEPKIELKFDINNLQPGLWNRTKVSVMNKGLACAKDIQVKLSGPIEVRRFPVLDKLSYNETKTIEIGLKPDSAGSVPVDINIKSIRTWDGEPYHEHIESWLDIDHSISTSAPPVTKPQSHPPESAKPNRDRKSDDGVECIYCQEPIKRSAPIFKCNCGIIYHLECVNEIESCVKCNAHIREHIQVVRGGLPGNKNDDIEWE